MIRPTFGRRISGLSGVVLWFISSVAGAQSVPAPVVNWVSDSTYVISYQACSQCLGDALEEYDAQSQSWVFIGSGSQSFDSRAAGSYDYRVAYALVSSTGYYQLAYSGVLTVVVGDAASAVSENPSLPTQLSADYEIVAGDIDGNGIRDLLVRRSRSGPDWGPGPIDDVLLRQGAGGTFAASIPNQYELSIAASWSPTPIEVRKRDVNIDGYADLVLRGVDRADGFSSARNQILFAAGETPSGVPVVRSVDDRLATFSRDINRHLIDPEYYSANVPVSYTLIIYYSLICGWPGYYDSFDIYYQSLCFYQPQYFLIAYQDFSAFDQDAISIASADYGMIYGYEPIESGMQTIAAGIESVLDVQLGEGALDPLLAETASATTDAVRRGIELFSALAGISEAVAQEVDVSPSAASSERVQIRGRRVLGTGPFHTSLEFRYSTVSAYDSDPQPLIDGLLISEVNWPRDHPSLTLRLGYVDGPGGPPLYWQSLLAADSRYDDDLRYDLLPSLGEGGYNSNSFSSGLIQATGGLPTIEMATFVGGERPVPASEFN